MPDVVVFVDSTEDIKKILSIAFQHGVPVVPRGAGTSLSGQVVPTNGGIVLDMTRMNTVLEVCTSELYCTVEPGVVYSELNKMLENHGFFFAPAPGSGDICTIGGMVGNNASGIRTVKYGATRDLVIGLKVVLPGGKIIEAGGRTLKNASGYNVEKIFVGSEGTLGVFTEIRLRVHPLPESKSMIISCFDSVKTLSSAILRIFSSGRTPSSVEIIDRRCLSSIRKKYVDFPEGDAVLMIESDGHKASVREDIRKISSILSMKGGKCEIIDDEFEIENIWSMRKDILPLMARNGNLHSVPLCDDISVPLKYGGNFLEYLRMIEENFGVIIGAYGHAGEGNFHLKIMIDPLSRNAWDDAVSISDKIYRYALQLGGGTSGEHGIGITKGKYFRWERKTLIEYMRDMKKIMDPTGIMNPGKIFDAPEDILYMNRFFWQGRKFSSKIEREIITCAMCGYCRYACPFYEGNEYLSPRGRMTILMGIWGGKVDVDTTNIRNLYMCTLCDRCSDVCSSDLNIADIMRDVRECIGMTLLDERYKNLMSAIFSNGNIYGIDMPSDFFIKGKSDGNILYFSGCISSYSESHISRSSIEILKKLNINFFVTNEICCGYPLYLMKYKFIEYSEKFKEFIDNLDCDRIVVSCDGCYRTLKYIHKLNVEVLHISDLMSENKVNFKRNKKKKVFLHASCDLFRHTDCFEKVKNVMSLTSDYRIIDECCGGGGCVRVGYDDVAIDAARKIIKNLSGTLVATCPSCYQVFSSAAAENIKVIPFTVYVIGRWK